MIDDTTLEVVVMVAYLAGCIFGMAAGLWIRL